MEISRLVMIALPKISCWCWRKKQLSSRTFAKVLTNFLLHNGEAQRKFTELRKGTAMELVLHFLLMTTKKMINIHLNLDSAPIS